MRYRLPVVIERAVRESEAGRQAIVENFEAELRRQLADDKRAVTCLKGCNHCCHYPMMLSVLEGVTLFRHLAEHGLWRKALQDKFKEAHKRVWGLSPSVWMLSMTPCPLLTDQGLCGAYEGRPFVCRTTTSIGDPYACHPHRFSDGQAGLVPRRDADLHLQEIENRLLKVAGITLLRLPLATAVLTGEKLCKDQMDPVDIASQLFEEWARDC